MTIDHSTVLASIPSPTRNVWHLGPLPLRAYAFCILLGVLLAVVVSDRRLRARGGPPGLIVDVAVWAVPFGIIGARIYHVVTSSGPYFGEGGHPLDAFKVWEGGLGIWGAILGGALGAWIACRRAGLPLRVLADVVAPGIVLAQALGRWGNWFNNELYGRETSLPWGLKVHAMGADGHSLGELPGTYHPTFLYESLWCVGVAILLLWAERRFRLGHGRVFALYMMAYTVGRAWIEYLRIDEAHHILGLRLNDWTSLVVFVCGLVWFVTRRGGPERIEVLEDGRLRVYDVGSEASSSGDAGADDAPAGSTEESVASTSGGGPKAATATEIRPAKAPQGEKMAPEEKTTMGDESKLDESAADRLPEASANKRESQETATAAESGASESKALNDTDG